MAPTAPAPLLCSKMNSKMAESEDNSASPDSTTMERLGFAPGEDVLLKKAERFYLGTIVEVDVPGERCLVKFLDNTSAWSSVKELTKLASEPKVTCVLCKSSQSKADNTIVSCDKCGRGYHQLCHTPPVKIEDTLPEAHWNCRKCGNTSLSKEVLVKSMVKPNIRKVCSGRDKRLPPPDDKAKLPYDPEMLTWDSYHRVNAEQIYCYCGLNGEWYTQMLQCTRCKQWFHEKCVGCLSNPLYSGDRFYVFVCSMCNFGKEYVRRLEIKWVDLVHLMLYNLTVYNAKKYYDLDEVIVPYANEHWEHLQLPDKIRCVSVPVRRESILAILSNNRNRFKCGREIKKRTTIWGLRMRLPPPCPIINLPAGIINDAVLKEYRDNKKRLPYLKESNGNFDEQKNKLFKLHASISELIHRLELQRQGQKENLPGKQDLMENLEISVNPSDVVLQKSIHQNISFDNSLKANSFNDFPQIFKNSNVIEVDEEIDEEVNNDFETMDDDLSIEVEIKHEQISKASYLDDDSNVELNENDTNKEINQSNIQLSKLIKLPLKKEIPQEDNGNVHEVALKKSPFKSNEETTNSRYSGGGFVKKSVPFPEVSSAKRRRFSASSLNNSSEQSSSNPKNENTLAKDTEKGSNMRWARYRKARKLLKNAIANSKFRPSESSELPPTPPTSVSGPPTPPTSASLLSTSDLSVPSSVELTQQTTPVDTSGDETSSRGTLDSFIPPPKDFEGQNNPFRNLQDLLDFTQPQQTSQQQPLCSYPPITLPLSLTPVIPEPQIARPIKRKLSEKDIIIDRNGQVKRRRQNRRGRPPGTSLQNQQLQAASKTAAIIPARYLSNEARNSHMTRNLRSSSISQSPSFAQQRMGGSTDYPTSDQPVQQSLTSNESLQAPKLESPPTVKHNAPRISMNDLKSSVNMYFSAPNRIALGEKFVVKAKRIGANGETQFLIEWEGLST